MFDWDNMRPAKSAEQLYQEAQERRKKRYWEKVPVVNCSKTNDCDNQK